MTRFQLFRYQILPLDRYIQSDLINGIRTVEDLLKRKNQFFSESIRKTNNFRSSRTEIITKNLLDKDDFFLYRVAANRSIHRETKDFKEELLDNWPSVLIGIWNHPDIQLIAIQKRSLAFQKNESVIKMMTEAIKPFLETQHLRMHVEALFEKEDFWDIIDKYEGKVLSLEFDFVTPNMANLSNTLPENLKNLAKQTNSATNKLGLQADSESALNIQKSNNNLSPLVDYSSEGGGNIAVKISGIKKKHQTSNTVKEFEADEAILQGTAEEVVSAMKELMR